MSITGLHPPVKCVVYHCVPTYESSFPFVVPTPSVRNIIDHSPTGDQECPLTLANKLIKTPDCPFILGTPALVPVPVDQTDYPSDGPTPHCPYKPFSALEYLSGNHGSLSFYSVVVNLKSRMLMKIDFLFLLLSLSQNKEKHRYH